MAKHSETTAGLRPLADIFNAAAKEYHDSFPDQLANLFLTLGDAPIYVSAGAAKLVTGSAAEVKNMIARRRKDMDARGWSGMVGPEDVNGGRLQHMSLNEEAHTLISDKYPASMVQMALFDHEMGHLLVREGSPLISNSHVAECAADAFAVLRHIQRFGRVADVAEIFDQGLLNRTGAIVAGFAPSFYYTTPVIQKIAGIQRRGEIDIAALTLRETANLAGELAIKYSFGQNTLDKISAAYTPVHKVYDREGTMVSAPVVMAIARVMSDNRNDDDIHRAGRLLLSHPRMKPVIRQLQPERRLQEMLALLKRHEKETGILLNVAAAVDAARAARKKRSPAPS
jgi:hypothetical protein